MPRNINGDFKSLGPVNPRRNRVTADASALSNKQRGLSTRCRDFSGESGDPAYPKNLIICGKAEKLGSTERKVSNSSNID